MAKPKTILDYTGPLFIRPLMGGVLFVGEPGLSIDDLPEDGSTVYVRLRIEQVDGPEAAVEPADYRKK
jgi:hypothetical protein